MSSSFPVARFPSLPLGKQKEIAEPTLTGTSPVRSDEEPSDEALIGRVCGNDSEALGMLFRRHARLVWTIAHRILRNSAEADDLLQDLFLLVRRRASVFDPSKGTVRSLLVQMCYQRAFSRRRDLMRRHFYTAGQITENTGFAKASSSAPFYDESLEAHFGKAGLQKAFNDLTEEQRETLRLCFFEGHTLEEVAAAMNQSYANVRHHYYRGLEKLRKHLKANGL